LLYTGVTSSEIVENIIVNTNLTRHMEQVVNRLLALDQETMIAMSKYAGSVIAVDLMNTRMSAYILITSNGINLSGQIETEPDVRICGTPLQLIKYLVAMNQEDPAQAGALQISGNVALAQAVQTILKNIDLDWEEELSRWVGDTLAHKAGNTVNKTASFLKRTNQTVKMDVSEYLRYETEILPDKSVMDEFNSSVDTLRDDVEHLKLRIQRIQQSFRRE